MKTAINLVERGLVPDLLTRAGIRRLCAQRLAHESRGAADRQRELLASLSRGLARSRKRPTNSTTVLTDFSATEVIQ